MLHPRGFEDEGVLAWAEEDTLPGGLVDPGAIFPVGSAAVVARDDRNYSLAVDYDAPLLHTLFELSFLQCTHFMAVSSSVISVDGASRSGRRGT